MNGHVMTTGWLRILPLVFVVACLLPGLASADGSKDDGAQDDAAEVDVEVRVQLVSELKVIRDSGGGVVVSAEKSFVGDPSPGGPVDNMGHIRLITDLCIGGLAFDFPNGSGFRGQAGAIYGTATSATGDVLGVQPFVRHPGGVTTFGSLSGLNGSASAPPLVVSRGGNGFCHGLHDFFVGLGTRWDLTLPGQPRFAAPGNYSIPVTVIIIP